MEGSGAALPQQEAFLGSLLPHFWATARGLLPSIWARFFVKMNRSALRGPALSGARPWSSHVCRAVAEQRGLLPSRGHHP